MTADNLLSYEMHKQLNDLKKDIDSKLETLAAIDKKVIDYHNKTQALANAAVSEFSDEIDGEGLKALLKKPYTTINAGNRKLFVVVPKLAKNLQVGWLFKEDEAFWVYQVDQYSRWLDDLPEDILQLITEEQPLDAYVEADKLYFAAGQREEIKAKLSKHLKSVNANTATIIKGHEFEIIADLVAAGSLPFRPRPVAAADRRPLEKIKLRDYQVKAYNEFLNRGAIGVFYPTGAGKSFIAMAALETVKGPKVIIVPSLTLSLQWANYIEENIPHLKNEILITTYQGFKNYNQEFALVIYDECQRLPANTFSKLALVRTKYRIGLSASPHREDGRERYIYALTGFPVGLDWAAYMKRTERKYPPVTVHVVRKGEIMPGYGGIQRSKLKVLQEILNKKKTIIFCDSIEIGKGLGKALNVPFVYGETKNRLEIILQSQCVIASRVADLGTSDKKLQRTIEIDFLFGSRQQELQRIGRDLHSLEDTTHDVIMTDEELQKYGKRLWSLREKGFQLKIKEWTK